MADRNPVAKPSSRWEELDQLRQIIAPLWGGTLAMRERHDLMPPHEGELVVVPREPNEIDTAPEVIRDRGGLSRSYGIRLQRAVLWPEYRRQMLVLAGKVFRRPLKLGDDVPTKLQGYAEDIDRRGTNFHNFALQRFLRGLRDGLTLILVDAPRAQVEKGEDARRRTAIEEAAAGIRPYVVPYDAEQLLGIRTEVVNGRWRLTQVRLYECSTEPDGDYGEIEVERVRVLSSPATGQVFSETWKKRKGTDEDFAIDLKKAPINNVREIPLVPVYGNWEHAYFDAEPAFIDLALLNIRDWQMSADIDNMLRVSMVPKPYVTGIEPGTLRDQRWSADDLLELKEPRSRILFAEIEGKGMSLAMKNRDDGRALMKLLGLELLMPMRSGQMTDDEVQARSTDALSPLQALALSLQDSLEQVLRFMAQYHKLGEDAGGSVEISSKVFLTAGEVRDIQTLLKLREGRGGRPDIDRITMLENVKRLTDALGDDDDPKAINAKVELELRAGEILTGRLDELGADPEDGEDAGKEKPEEGAGGPPAGNAGDRAA